MRREIPVTDWWRAKCMGKNSFRGNPVIFTQPCGKQGRHAAAKTMPDNSEEALLSFEFIFQYLSQAVFDQSIVKSNPFGLFFNIMNILINSIMNL
jgi:hypothetical protein